MEQVKPVKIQKKTIKKQQNQSKKSETTDSNDQKRIHISGYRNQYLLQDGQIEKFIMGSSSQKQKLQSKLFHFFIQENDISVDGVQIKKIKDLEEFLFNKNNDFKQQQKQQVLKKMMIFIAQEGNYEHLLQYKSKNCQCGKEIVLKNPNNLNKLWRRSFNELMTNLCELYDFQDEKNKFIFKSEEDQYRQLYAFENPFRNLTKCDKDSYHLIGEFYLQNMSQLKNQPQFDKFQKQVENYYSQNNSLFKEYDEKVRSRLQQLKKALLDESFEPVEEDCDQSVSTGYGYIVNRIEEMKLGSETAFDAISQKSSNFSSGAVQKIEFSPPAKIEEEPFKPMKRPNFMCKTSSDPLANRPLPQQQQVKCEVGNVNMSFEEKIEHVDKYLDLGFPASLSRRSSNVSSQSIKDMSFITEDQPQNQFQAQHQNQFQAQPQSQFEPQAQNSFEPQPQNSFQPQPQNQYESQDEDIFQEQNCSMDMSFHNEDQQQKEDVIQIPEFKLEGSDDEGDDDVEQQQESSIRCRMEMMCGNLLQNKCTSQSFGYN